jgi:hypothetical protein
MIRKFLFIILISFIASSILAEIPIYLRRNSTSWNAITNGTWDGRASISSVETRENDTMVVLITSMLERDLFSGDIGVVYDTDKHLELLDEIELGQTNGYAAVFYRQIYNNYTGSASLRVTNATHTFGGIMTLFILSDIDNNKSIIPIQTNTNASDRITLTGTAPESFVLAGAAFLEEITNSFTQTDFQIQTIVVPTNEAAINTTTNQNAVCYNNDNSGGDITIGWEDGGVDDKKCIIGAEFAIVEKVLYFDPNGTNNPGFFDSDMNIWITTNLAWNLDPSGGGAAGPLLPWTNGLNDVAVISNDYGSSVGIVVVDDFIFNNGLEFRGNDENISFVDNNTNKITIKGLLYLDDAEVTFENIITGNVEVTMSSSPGLYLNLEPITGTWQFNNGDVFINGSLQDFIHLILEGGVNFQLDSNSNIISSLSGTSSSAEIDCNVIDDTYSLIVNQEKDTTYEGIIDDNPSSFIPIIKHGKGSLTLNGQITASSDAPANEVHQGMLVMNSDINSVNVEVDVFGGTLAGAGRVDNITVYKGGTLNPGNPDEVYAEDFLQFDFTDFNATNGVPLTNTSVLANGVDLVQGLDLASDWIGTLTRVDEDDVFTWYGNFSAVETTKLYQAINNNYYMNFVIKPEYDHILDLSGSQLKMTYNKNFHAPRHYSLFTSVDGFKTPFKAVDNILTSRNKVTNSPTIEFNLTDSRFSSIIEPIEFRIYFYGCLYNNHPFTVTDMSLLDGRVHPPTEIPGIFDIQNNCTIKGTYKCDFCGVSNIADKLIVGDDLTLESDSRFVGIQKYCQVNKVPNGTFTNDFRRNSGTTQSDDIDNGWTEPGSARWSWNSLDNTGAVLGDDGAIIMCNWFTDNYAIKGNAILKFRARNINGSYLPNTLRAEVQGVRHAPSGPGFSNWNWSQYNDSWTNYLPLPVPELLINKTFTFTEDFEWKVFNISIGNVGNGYPYYLIRIGVVVGTDVRPTQGDELEIDDVELLSSNNKDYTLQEVAVAASNTVNGTFFLPTYFLTYSLTNILAQYDDKGGLGPDFRTVGESLIFSNRNLNVAHIETLSGTHWQYQLPNVVGETNVTRGGFTTNEWYPTLSVVVQDINESVEWDKISGNASFDETNKFTIIVTNENSYSEMVYSNLFEGPTNAFEGEYSYINRYRYEWIDRSTNTITVVSNLAVVNFYLYEWGGDPILISSGAVDNLTSIGSPVLGSISGTFSVTNDFYYGVRYYHGQHDVEAAAGGGGGSTTTGVSFVDGSEGGATFTSPNKFIFTISDFVGQDYDNMIWSNQLPAGTYYYTNIYSYSHFGGDDGFGVPDIDSVSGDDYIVYEWDISYANASNVGSSASESLTNGVTKILTNSGSFLATNSFYFGTRFASGTVDSGNANSIVTNLYVTLTSGSTGGGTQEIATIEAQARTIDFDAENYAFFGEFLDNGSVKLGENLQEGAIIYTNRVDVTKPFVIQYFVSIEESGGAYGVGFQNSATANADSGGDPSDANSIFVRNRDAANEIIIYEGSSQATSFDVDGGYLRNGLFYITHAFDGERQFRGSWHKYNDTNEIIIKHVFDEPLEDIIGTNTAHIYVSGNNNDGIYYYGLNVSTGKYLITEDLDVENMFGRFHFNTIENNIYLGERAGESTTSTTNSTIVGKRAGFNGDNSQSVIFGAGAGEQ